MSHASRTSKRKRRRKTLPVLGVAGLSLSLVSGVSAAALGAALDVPMRNAASSNEITLTEQEIFGVSLATFCVFDKEDASTRQPGMRLAMGGCSGGGCAGCGGCGGCWTGTYYTNSVFGGSANPPPHRAKPAHTHRHASKRTNAPKNP
jgi:hypothetical protein